MRKINLAENLSCAKRQVIYNYQRGLGMALTPPSPFQRAKDIERGSNIDHIQ
jgi:hypothetical protein